MDRQTRIDLLVDHYKHPRHRGRLEPVHVSMPGGNPGCGDVVTIHLRTDAASEHLEEVSFEGEGCTISQAAASILMQRMNRKHPSLDEILELSYEEMIDLLGRDVVGSRPRCATLALGTLKAAVRRIQMDRRLRAAGRSDAEIASMRQALEAQASGDLVFGEDAVAAAQHESERPAQPPGAP